MAVAVTIDIPGGNEQMIAKPFPEGKLPEGWQAHITGESFSDWLAPRGDSGGLVGARPPGQRQARNGQPRTS
jgi:hypothetical protein